MDLVKAKNIIMALLVAFNVFLLASNINITYVSGQNSRKETIKNAEAILSRRGVTLECDIPDTPNAVRRFVYKKGVLNRDEAAKKLLGDDYSVSGEKTEYTYGSKRVVFTGDTEFVFTDEQPRAAVDIYSDEKAEKAARQFLKGKGFLNGKYVVDKLERRQDGSVLVAFIESCEGFLLYDNYCTVTLTDKGVTGLACEKHQVIGFSTEKIESTAAYQALLLYFNEVGNTVITGIDNGYWLDDVPTDNMESIELLPVWRVFIKGEPGPLYLGTQR